MQDEFGVEEVAKNKPVAQILFGVNSRDKVKWVRILYPHATENESIYQSRKVLKTVINGLQEAGAKLDINVNDRTDIWRRKKVP
jgi:hypothetical protein